MDGQGDRPTTTDAAVPSRRPPGDRAGLRFGWSVALIVLAVGVAAAWGFGRGDSFLYQDRYWLDASGRHPTVQVERVDQHTMLALVRSDRAWAFVAASILLIPLWFAIWRRTGIAGGRWIGAAWSMSVAIAVVVLVATRPVRPGMTLHGFYGSFIAAGVLLAVAFLVAPERRDDDAIEAITVARLLRRHRQSA